MGEFMFFFPLRVTPNVGYCVPSRMQKTEEKSFPITIVISLFFLFSCLAPPPLLPRVNSSECPQAHWRTILHPGSSIQKEKVIFFFFLPPCTSLDHRPLHHLHRSRGKNHRGKTIHDNNGKNNGPEHKSTREPTAQERPTTYN